MKHFQLWYNIFGNDVNFHILQCIVLLLTKLP